MSSLDEEFVNISFDDEVHAGRPLSEKWINHFSQDRAGTDTTITHALQRMYPHHSLIVTSDYGLQILGLPGAQYAPIPGETRLSHTVFSPPARRVDGYGALAEDIKFGAFYVEWQSQHFILYLAEWAEGFGTTRQHFILHKGLDETPIRSLILAASNYALELREEILVFEGGSWLKDHGLWVEVQKANWQDVILDENFKVRVQDDIHGFFKSEQVYRDLGVAWKRGVIFLGPPGNGKTISLKAIMKGSSHPSLYVKSFKSWAGEEASIRAIFTKARQMAPCILVLEDLDSLINDGNRSFFLNEVDGLESNSGILVIATTNHFDRLDPGLSSRPSRFDRKYLFPNPSHDERIQYGKYWQQKLKDNDSVAFPDSLLSEVADLTEDFSFAYLKEAFVSSLILLAGGARHDSFEVVLKEQIQSLRKQLDNPEGEKSIV
ncbi:hypothetical protein BOTBODRAFT_26605 [Botryobasidium botryosum FD-172 SS1]|uniref:AAA+ ATPase domain-containing protein n=1 Tax=Botryobasidium botryosum (strain FD-172 SS1) TaxID=930990 RepID=A0A067N9X8_BOTB1|nr:hypothetical protein BOTBODRAFT_26605 [Botryobasidium botryosum FD-172 SS1]